MGITMDQYDICLVNLDPTIGHEIKKTRPCVVISPSEMNKHIGTIIIAPLTTKSHDYPTRISVSLRGRTSWIILDQIRTIDKSRIQKKLGVLHSNTIKQVKQILMEMFIE
jgi:mRNA interferase MazF